MGVLPDSEKMPCVFNLMNDAEQHLDNASFHNMTLPPNDEGTTGTIGRSQPLPKNFTKIRIPHCQISETVRAFRISVHKPTD